MVAHHRNFRELVKISLCICLLIGVMYMLFVYRSVLKNSKSHWMRIWHDNLLRTDLNMKENDSEAIHIVQMLIGPKSVRFQTIFLKSLFMHHFEMGQPNPMPIHFHFLTDNVTRNIIEAKMASWRVNNVSMSFYPAEPIQARLGWMRSQHPATKVASMKLYIPEILNSSVSKILLLDSDVVFMVDAEEMWRLFDEFDKYQFLGMVREQAPVSFDLRAIGGNLQTYGFNAGIMMWHLKKISQDTWNKIWNRTHERRSKISSSYAAAEQTLINFVIMENPTILKELHCTWNLQMYEPVRSDNCWSTWNRSPGDGIESPKLLHADAVNKAENEFQALEPSALAKNVGDIKKRYIAIRSQYHLMNGYMFRHSPIEPPAFDIGRIMKRSYPDRQLLNSEKLCKSHWSFLKTWCQGVHHFVYNIYNRIHPLYVYQNHPILTNNSNQISLVVSVDFNKYVDYY
ncbi:unnamed protein product [Hymenolepis diminuta]|uniref:Nucleotide-diphospho-sugar transferase domain-containing protein n=2 Tax=Hymenolepis diminuta TaxID=6216 RepID=A0A564Z430_HYMDI|nr:unnamed protein product [Hymenolepis diminuta]